MQTITYTPIGWFAENVHKVYQVRADDRIR